MDEERRKSIKRGYSKLGKLVFSEVKKMIKAYEEEGGEEENCVVPKSPKKPENDESGDTKKEKKKPVKKRVTKERDPNKPKRAKNAFMFYLNEKRPEITQELTTAEGNKPRPQDVNTRAGVEWKLISAEEKAPYEELATGDKARYKEEMAAYTPKETCADDEKISC